MILQANVSLGRQAESGKLRELAFGNPLVPLIAPFAEVVVADTIDGNFPLLPNPQINLVPLAGGPRGVRLMGGAAADGFLNGRCPLRFQRLIKPVQPAGLLCVTAQRIVKHLNFGSRIRSIVSILSDMKHDAAISSGRDAIFDRQLKVLELINGNDVAGSILDTNQRTVLHLPAIGNFFLPIIAPAAGCFSIE